VKLFVSESNGADDDDDDDDDSFILCFSGNDVVLLQPTEFEHQIINRTFGQFNTVVTCET